MKNILVVGNSHTSSILQGIRGNNLPDNVKFDFLALGGIGFKNLKVKGKRIVTPQHLHERLEQRYGMSSAHIDHYDSILYVAGLSRLNFSLYSSDRKIPKLSDVIIKIITTNIGQTLFDTLRSTTDPSRLFYLGGPLSMSNCTRDDTIQNRPLVKNSDDISYANKLSSKIRLLCENTTAASNHFSILLPPSHLLDKYQFNTLKEYMRPDRVHANEEYGKIIIPYILKHILGNTSIQ